MTARFRPAKGLTSALGPFDRVGLVLMLILAVLTALLYVRGNPPRLRVTDYSWQNSKIGAQDRVLRLSFNQPLRNQGIVQKSLTIDPPLQGQWSGQGRHFFYTLSELPRYGTNYQVKLEVDPAQVAGKKFDDFVTLLSTHDRAFVYIGVGGEERGRLILFNITNPQKPSKTILTPKDLLVQQFQIYPQGDRLIFLAYDPNQRNPSLQVFSVTTGVKQNASQQEAIPGKIERLLSDANYDNLQLTLASNGQTLVWRRVNRQNKADSGLWVWPEGENPRPLGVNSQNFSLSAQGRWLAFSTGSAMAIAEQWGVSVMPLEPKAGAFQFFAGYGQPLAFSPDETELMVSQPQTNYQTNLLTLSLKDGAPQASLPLKNPLLDCQIQPRQIQTLYCLQKDVVQREDGNAYEEPFLSVLDRNRQESRPLLTLPNYPDVKMSVAPDGLAILFDQVGTAPASSDHDLFTPSQQSITDGRVWLLELPDRLEEIATSEVIPQELAVGFAPQWMP